MSYAGPDVARMLACISSSAPQSLVLVPELLRVLVAAAERGWHGAGVAALRRGGRRAGVGRACSSAPRRPGCRCSKATASASARRSSASTRPQARRRGSVGRPLPHARVRVADDGQIMVSGVTMHGYLGQPPRRAGEEWATGDLGEIDADGYVYVRGRLRNIYITQPRPQRGAGVGRARNRAAARHPPA